VAVTEDPKDLRRDDFPVHREIPTRWADVDAYGHVNNVVHYALFDTAVNAWLIETTGEDVRTWPQLGLVVETSCRYFAELDFPAAVTAGLAVSKLGNSSISYRLALFGAAAEPAAVGHFVHVYVDRDTRRPVPVPQSVRSAAEAVLLGRRTQRSPSAQPAGLTPHHGE
jgi:acyl-CoA thioester hydrolase